MTTMIIKIENESPEVRKILEYLNTLSGVSVINQSQEGTKAKSVWDKAIAEGAVSIDEFIDEVKRQLKTQYETTF